MSAQLSQLKIRRDAVWQGSVRRLPVWVTPDAQPPFRPHAAVWASARGRPVHMTHAAAEPGDVAALAWTGFEELARHEEYGGELPAKVELVDAALADALRPRLEALGIQVRLVDRVGAVDAAISAFHQHAGGNPLPGLFDAPDVFEPEARAFHDAALRFYRARPWRGLTDEDVFRVSGATAPGMYDWGVVLGAAGQEFGLALFRSRTDHERMLAGDRDAMSEGLIVFFGPIVELPLDDADWMTAHGIEVAGPEAWSWALERRGRAEMRRPGARLLARAEQVLRVFAAASDEDFDAGRWTTTVASARGDVDVTIELPDLLGETPPQVPGRPPRFSREAGERIMVEMTRFLASQDVRSPAQAQRLMNERFVGSIDEIPSTGTTPLEKAQELCWKAWEARGRRVRHLAREALALSPDCADAYVLLARSASTEDERLRLLREGVAAGERALGEDRFREGAPFWGDVTTRPYMRALFDLMLVLVDGDNYDTREAMRLGERLLSLNPGDNQGVRLPLVQLYLELGEADAARRVLAQFRDDRQATLEFARALLAYRDGGDTAASRKLLRRAMKANAFAIDLLTGMDEEDAPYPAEYAPGSPEEAVVVAEHLAPAWESTEGASEWALKTQERRR